ncbi:cellulose-binding domain protein [Geminocystis sp. NIES-3708]|uniref:hypothetical protein n=1 Tax=Geminocystis sp. NIES-3708 TaxID=1615909 RepID=UPI0005FC68C9|nr:hypothetical protein [Geminocystis sp. NIES-3708]BAQ62821.1 cellulose-binding domain protein [Geminocystis sp. NIES-3708]
MITQNIVTDSLFNLPQQFNNNLGTTDWTNANQGWFVPLNTKWNKSQESAYADNSGAGGLTQVITNNQLNKGLQTISFDALNKGISNTLRIQIYGINGKFKLNNWKADNPISATTDPIQFTTLMDTGNVATQSFDWKNFTQDVDFGSGYEYIAIRAFTDGVESSESMAIDNISIAQKKVLEIVSIIDSDFNELNMKFNTNTGITYFNNADKGWFVPINSKWIRDSVNGYTYADNTGAGGLTQVIKNNQITQGLQYLNFDAINKGTSNTLRIQIYGVNGEFKISNWETKDPLANTLKPINFSTLLDTGNIASKSFDWSTFSQQINFNNGYEYIAIRVITDGVEGSEFMAIDNVSIANDILKETVEQTEPPNNPVVNNSISIGTNLGGIAYWSPQKPFINLFKSSSSWITQGNGIWDTQENALLDLDQNGWVRSFPKPENGAKFTSVGTLLSRSDGNYLGGEYVVLYEGEGTIKYGFDAKLISSTPGRDVIQVNPTKAGILLSITQTDPNQTGNYIRDINVVPVASENTYETEIFNPDFINHIDSFNSIRFMNWMGTNDSTQKEWSNRPTLDSQTWFGNGVSVEVMVDLANKEDVNPWFTLPHLATDEYITNFATYVRDHLDPELKIYVEYSNEVWNGQFKQSRWVAQQAQTENMSSPYDWYSRRTTQITQIWDQVFGSDQDRVVGVMGAQAGNIGTANRALNYNWTNNPLSHEQYGIDAITIAPYFGHYIGDKANKDTLLSWTKEADGGLNKLFDEITKGGLLPNSPKGGALQLAYDRIGQYVELAKQENLQLIAYEGGQHLVDKSEDPAIVDLFAKANRDSRMGDIYKEYFQQWFNMGGGEFLNFTDVGSYNKFGSWGLTESLNQNSPKYDAVIDLINSTLP